MRDRYIYLRHDSWARFLVWYGVKKRVEVQAERDFRNQHFKLDVLNALKSVLISSNPVAWVQLLDNGVRVLTRSQRQRATIQVLT